MERKISFKRKTSETAVEGAIDLDGKGKARISTGIGFLNHMLELFAFHSGFDLEVKCKGDLDICAHHSIEDIALTIGQAFYDVLGERKGIKRYSTCYLPMDETLTRTVIDISGRPYHVFRGSFEHSSIGLLPTEMVKHFFYS
ncbi:imidazoleglycerol-phosphate dehydratase, partial [bacterium]|nr:imidazoleglycerol-phosphate dehydratase [bacterium]